MDLTRINNLHLRLRQHTGLTPHPQQQEFVPFSFEFLFGELWISVEPVKEGLLVLALLERTENLMDSFGAPIRDLQQDYKKEN